MQNALKKYTEEIQQYEKRFVCSHEKLNLKKRKVKGGAFQYVKQCLVCGNAMPQPIKQEVALSANGGIEPSSFDEKLQIDWKTNKEQAYSEIKERYESSKKVEIAEHTDEYWEYLNSSPEWQLKRRKVFARAKNICEGCAEQPATEVHHISYDNIFDELLYQLVALCEDCHKKAHGERSEDEDAGTA